MPVAAAEDAKLGTSSPSILKAQPHSQQTDSSGVWTTSSFLKSINCRTHQHAISDVIRFQPIGREFGDRSSLVVWIELSGKYKPN